MSRFWMTGIAGLVGITLLTCGRSFANDQTASIKTTKHTAQKPVAADAYKIATKASASREHVEKAHLPAAFAKLNLTPDQHQKAMAVVEKYAGQITQLRSQIRDLQTKRDSELAAFLNDAQKKTLAEARTSPKRAQEPARTTAATSPKPAANAAAAVATHHERFHINPAELKALHDQAMKNLAAES